MISKNEGLGRRVLTFPAVYPCEGISPATLLESLVDLSHKICGFRSKKLVTQKRNIREFIRQIEILSIFFEEVHDRRQNPPESVFLCFSELHLVFQKLLFLLEDCICEGAKLFMLMKCEKVSNFFRILIRGVAISLDVLDLKYLDLSAEVKEMIELVKSQAWRAKFEVESEENSVLNSVWSILDQFESQIVPRESDLRRVLDFLEITSWRECNREAHFLSSQLGLGNSNSEETEAPLLCSLMGFMSYARGVLFDTICCDNVSGESDNQSMIEFHFNQLNPEDFRCPISLEIMSDPVTVATGQTYDRSSIEKWFRAGNLICPTTGQKLNHTELVPNLVMQRLVRRYASENGIQKTKPENKKRDVLRTVNAGSKVAQEALKMVSGFLACKLAVGSNEEKNKAAFEIRLLAKASIFNRSCLAQSGTIPHLLTLLSSVDSNIQENAIGALYNLSKYSKSKAIIVENKGLKLILDVLKNGLKIECRQLAAATLFYLSSVEEYRLLIGKMSEVFSALTELIKDGANRSKKNALAAIFGLLVSPENHWRVISAGAIPLLVEILKGSKREEIVTNSLAVLATLAEKPVGTLAILRRGVIDTVVEIFGSSTSNVAKECCVSLLLALCINGGVHVIGMLVKKTSLMGPMYSLLSEDTGQASKKASALIRVLHEYHERNSSDLSAPSLPQERFVHVR
ncbi:Armadillo [Dillenia turbinata]|uniref:RING-type E3 ubiquitin transferase n=1 Tax=Dillenia turbinata TaxID=194707 RepID=A0AAN8VJY0_9MAGN